MIVGITGTLGAGKGTVAEYLHKKHGFIYLSVRNFFAEEVLKRGLMVSRETIGKVAGEVRAQHGETYPVEQLLARMGNARKVVVESLRTAPEAALLKSRGGVVWCIDADPKIRYQRTMGRALEKDRDRKSVV